jgi:hypothetical protein
MQKQIKQLRNLPHVKKAWVQLRKHDIIFDTDDKKSDDAREKYDAAMQPATLLEKQCITKKNEFIFRLLTTALDNHDETVLSQFRELVSRTSIPYDKITQLPDEYYKLISLSIHPNITAGERNNLLWQIAEKWKYLGPDSSHLLVPVVLEFYRIVLGDPENIHMPDSETDSGLSAARQLVFENKGLFKSATQEQMQILVQYGISIQRLKKMILGNEFLTSGNPVHDQMLQEKSNEAQDPYEWQKEKLRRIEEVINELEYLAKEYKQFLLIEEVKVKPNTYYPWLLEKLIPFWTKVNWDVGEGNRPTPMMRSLYEFLHQYIEKDFVYKKDGYPENFDCINEGNLYSFLSGLYTYIRDHDLGYYQSVWIEGHGFMFMAIYYMPEDLINRMIEMDPGTHFAKALQQELTRREKENKDAVL